MKKWRLCGCVNVDVYVSVEAETLEEAIEIAEDECRMEEYCNNTVGVDYWSADAVSDGDVCCSYEIEWEEQYCELEDEWEDDDDE